jgi:hypothetical protein
MQEPTEGIMEDQEEVDAIAHDEAGLTTAELLGNAALGVLALVAHLGAPCSSSVSTSSEWIRASSGG